MDSSLAGAVQQWLAIDVNPTTLNQINDLVYNEQWGVLSDLLSRRIIFGTAGLRAQMEAGFNRMNDVTVLQATQGLAEYIKLQTNNRIFVVAHDHRLNSQRFAQLTAAIFLSKGFKVYFIGPGLSATPMVPFAIDKYCASAGVMITASHNPKNDNGYKVYWDNGCQIIPPHDFNIEQSILKNLKPIDEIVSNNWKTDALFSKYKDHLIYCKEEIKISYLNHLLKTHFAIDKISGFKAIYTAMHGVGTEFVRELTDQIAPNVITYVSEQCTPDPYFKTVSFPNPEEKGALNLAIAEADKLKISLVIANDPDADRFSFAVKHQQIWKQLTGNEIGILFADFIISNYANGQDKDLSDVWLLNSTVSSQMLNSMALKLGFNFTDTLTGFKWIGNKAIELESENLIVPFAYEEAIGYMFKGIHDKDGIAALLVFLQLYQWLLNMNSNPLERLNYLYENFGYFKECNGYFICQDVENIFNSKIRAAAGSRSYPEKIGQWDVIYWRDLTYGFESNTVGNKPLLPVDPNSQMITAIIKPPQQDDVTGADKVRFTVRGSGTEPKLKVYIEAKSSSAKQASELAQNVWDLLKLEWFAAL